MKYARGVTLHPQSLFTVESIISFQIFHPHKIEIANTKGRFALLATNWTFALNGKANLFVFLEILYSRNNVFLNLYIVIFPLKEVNLVFCMAYQKCTKKIALLGP